MRFFQYHRRTVGLCFYDSALKPCVYEIENILDALPRHFIHIELKFFTKTLVGENDGIVVIHDNEVRTDRENNIVVQLMKFIYLIALGRNDIIQMLPHHDQFFQGQGELIITGYFLVFILRNKPSLFEFIYYIFYNADPAGIKISPCGNDYQHTENYEKYNTTQNIGKHADNVDMPVEEQIKKQEHEKKIRYVKNNDSAESRFAYFHCFNFMDR